MTPEELEARSARAVRAATDAARDLGLEIGEPVVLHDVFSVVVHLAPLPIVARVPMVLPPGLGGARLRERQQRELDLACWLADRAFPVVAPSPLVPRSPVQRGGFSMTFWELADVAEEHVPYGSADSAVVVDLHTALREYPAEAFPFLAPVHHSVPAMLEFLASRPELIESEDLDRARREWETLAPVLASRTAFEARFPAASIQAVHGDAPSYNVILTRSGPRFADFEDVCLAPIEWDLAMAPAEDIEGYNQEAARRGLPSLDVEVLRVMSAARALQMVGSLALVPQLPLLAEGLKWSLEAWRGMPFAGGLG